MKALALLILLLSSSLVVAQEFDTYSIKAEIFQDTVFEEVEITFSNISDLSYIVDGSIEELQVNSKDGDVTYSVDRGLPSFVVISNLSGKGHLRLAFKTDAPLLKKGGETEALFKVRYPLNVSRYSLRLTLPENSLPTSTRDAYSIFPTPTNMFIEESKYNIIWERKGIQEGEELTFTASFSPLKKSFVPYILLLTILVISIAGLLVYRRKKEELFLRGLDVDERKVVRLLQDGKEDQKEIQNELGISKVKMTRIVQKLEGKDLIRREKTGRRNKLFLK